MSYFTVIEFISDLYHTFEANVITYSNGDYMSFLARYWKAVEQKHAETGMSYNQIKVDIDQLIEENTTESNSVDNNNKAETSTDDCPIKDGIMPKSGIVERRSERPDDRFQEMEESPIRERTSRGNDRKNEERSAGMDNRNHSKKKTQRATEKLRRKALKKLGAGQRVNVRLDEVVIDGKYGFKQS